MGYRGFVHNSLRNAAPRFLPFADAATDDLPLSRLLRLSLFQVSVGMALVLLVGTLNRVMIVELGVPATLVAVMISLPIVFAPFRALVGFRSDNHVSALGWRRVPFIWKGSMLQFGGFAVMPFALLVLSGYGEAIYAPRWIGLVSAGFAFLMVGAGMHMVQTVGLALATDLSPAENHPKVVGLMYVMLLAGMVVSALIFGLMLEDYTPGKLIQAIQGAAVITLILNVTAVWKQESRDRTRAHTIVPDTDFMGAVKALLSHEDAKRRFTVIALGTMGFGMADVLLEPYGGQVLGLSVATTTKLTATLAAGSLIGFGAASRVLGRGMDPMQLAGLGTLIGLPAFAAIILATPTGSEIAFTAGIFAIGFGTGLFGHGTLTATMRLAPKEKVGLALGAWGAVQATSAGLAIALGGIMRDLVLGLYGSYEIGAPAAYIVVFLFELSVLIAAFGLISHRTSILKIRWTN